MNWDHLKIVLAVARGGSLTTGAHLLGVDQTTVGRRLTAIEDQVGAALFVRSKAGFEPTEQGQRVIRAAEEVEATLDALTDDISDPLQGAVGVVRILANPWMQDRLTNRGLKSLLDIHSGLELRFSGRLPPAPLHGEATLALWFDAAPRAPDIAVPIARLPYAAYEPEGDARTRNWVIFRDDDAQGPSFTRQIRRRIGTEGQVRLTATDALTLRNAAEAGIGRAILPCCLGDAAHCIAKAQDFEPISRVLHVHLNPDLLKTRRVQIVLQWLVGVLPEVTGAEMLRHDLGV